LRAAAAAEAILALLTFEGLQVFDREKWWKHAETNPDVVRTVDQKKKIYIYIYRRKEHRGKKIHGQRPGHVVQILQ